MYDEIKKIVGVSLVLVVGNSAAQAQEPTKVSVRKNASSVTASSLPNGSQAIAELRAIYRYINGYREINNGAYPPTALHLISVIARQQSLRGREGFQKAKAQLLNSDVQFADSEWMREGEVVPYVLRDKRIDGSSIDAPRTSGTRDLLAYTEIYVHAGVNSKQAIGANPSGFYVALWNDGSVEKIPYDNIFYLPDGHGAVQPVFSGQAGVEHRALSYEEGRTQFLDEKALIVGKATSGGRLIFDNGGPESLVKLSRLLNFPDRNGIAREDLWRNFSPSQEMFTLKQESEGATKLKLPLQNKKLTLAQLTTLHSPAILQMHGDIIAQNPLNPRPSAATSTTIPTSTVQVAVSDNRIVTLAQSGIEYSIVQDAGMTRVVRNVKLAELYSGEALLPQAASAPSALEIDNPVRVVPFQTKSDEVVQIVTLTNQGKTPLTLEIERPLPGVTKAELSSKTLAAGASATLTLNIKWREVLPGDVQQVFVTLKTSDPIQPRAMLGFRLQVPPAPPLNASPDSGAKPPVLP